LDGIKGRIRQFLHRSAIQSWGAQFFSQLFFSSQSNTKEFLGIPNRWVRGGNL
jgi:hypothetical protein